MTKINVPIFRGKHWKQGWVEGNLNIPLDHHQFGIEDVYITEIKRYYDDPQPDWIIDAGTLQVSMPGEVDENGDRVFKKLKGLK